MVKGPPDNIEGLLKCYTDTRFDAFASQVLECGEGAVGVLWTVRSLTYHFTKLHVLFNRRVGPQRNLKTKQNIEISRVPVGSKHGG